MLMKMRSKMQNQKGFTLVELMVVVVILGILVAIAIPVYNNIQARAQKSACQASARTILSAVEQYKAVHDGEAPDNLDELVGDTGYIKTTPMCPGDVDTKKAAKAFTSLEGACPNGIVDHALPTTP